MIYTIKNDEISISVKQMGAELCSVKTLSDNQEHIWQADPEFWDAHGPLLFPIVGQVRDDKIKIGGKECHLTNHGFLSLIPFTLQSQTEDSITLAVEYDENTLKNYPYKFKVIATYSIKNNTFEGKYEIINQDEKVMPYGFGLHNGFNCLNSDDEKIEDVYLEFDEPITVNKPTRTEDRMMDFANRIPVIENSKTLQFNDEWYPSQAPVMDNVTFRHFKLCHKDRGVILDYTLSEGFDLFNAWHAFGSKFMCLEPWTSQAGMYPYADNLEDIENTKMLESNQSKVYTFNVKF